MKIRRWRVDNVSRGAARAVVAIAALAAWLLAACVTSPGAADSTIGLPRARDYVRIAELRDIYFDFGKAEIRPTDLTILDANTAWLRAHPSYLVLIEGHSDNRGATDRKNEFNIDLGERRALAARSYLVAHGIEPSRITILSYGQERPQCAEQTEQCWSQNRRSRFLVKSR
jgi:peptidoglycan-associated lipoprotein